MEYRKIDLEDGVPIPESKGQGRKTAGPIRRALEKMEVGQSFLLINGEEFVYMLGIRVNSGHKTSTLYKHKWTILRDKHNPGTYRVWRVK